MNTWCDHFEYLSYYLISFLVNDRIELRTMAPKKRPTTAVNVRKIPRFTQSKRDPNAPNPQPTPNANPEQTMNNPGPQTTPQLDQAALETMIAQAVAAYMDKQPENSSGGIPTVTDNGGDETNPVEKIIIHPEEDAHPRNKSAQMSALKDFNNCNPKHFYGNGGMIELALWFDNMETKFQNISCPTDCKVRFAATTFRDAAQTWWGEHVRSTELDVTSTMPWEALKDLLMSEYCPKSVKKMMEQEFENLIMRDFEIETYTTRFNQLAALCPEMATSEHRRT